MMQPIMVIEQTVFMARTMNGHAAEIKREKKGRWARPFGVQSEAFLTVRAPIQRPTTATAAAVTRP